MIKTAGCALLLGVLGCHNTGAPDRPPSKEPNVTANTTKETAPGATAGSAAGKDRRARLRASIEARGANVHDELVAAAGDPDPFVRGEVAYQVAAIHDAQALEILGRLARDPSAIVRVQVVTALDALASGGAHALMLGFAVDDPSEDVRAETARALAHLDGADADRALERLARDPVAVVRERAAEVLASRRR